MTVRRFTLFCVIFPTIILLASVRNSSAQEIVLYASQAPVKVGNWTSVADSTAAGGARLANPDAGANKIVHPQANPSSYAELTFSVAAGIPYRIWVRGKAQDNSPYNDSIFVQFSGSLNDTGNADYRIGTTSATEINLEDCKGCGIQGWGWQDNGWGIGILGPAIFFQSSGTQTLRIQTREDGFSIDQIVLSPSTYLYNAPGALKNDGVILTASGGTSPTPTPTPSATPSLSESPNNTRLPPATQIVDSNLAVWTRTSSGAILRNGAGTSGTGSEILYCNRIVYVFGTDSQWYRWSNGWIAVGATDPCGGGGTPTSLTESPNNTRVPPATQIVDSVSAVWTRTSNGSILRNGAGTAGAGSEILYCNRTVYVFGTDSQWYQWANGWIAIGSVDPCTGSTPSTNQPPQVSISATPTSGTSPLFVSFNSAASDPDGNIHAYWWDFGNGSTSGMPSPTTTYQSAGTYTARLTVYDNAGATATATVQINVSAPAAPSTTSTLRVLSWNVAFGKGTDGVQNWDRQAGWIAQMNPDLAGLCEMPSEWVSTLVSLLSQKTGRTWYSHFLAKYDGTTEGNLILSKYPFSSTGGRYLSWQRSVAQATVNVGGRTINFFATHLDDGSSGIRYEQVGQLMSYASNFSESRVVVGDFNAGPDLSETVRMTGSYYDSWMPAMNAGTAVAYPDNPIWLHTRTRRGRIDYVYYSNTTPHLVLRGTQIPDTRDLNNTNVVITLGTLDDKGVRPSDHNPMIANFAIQ